MSSSSWSLLSREDEEAGLEVPAGVPPLGKMRSWKKKGITLHLNENTHLENSRSGWHVATPRHTSKYRNSFPRLGASFYLAFLKWMCLLWPREEAVAALYTVFVPMHLPASAGGTQRSKQWRDRERQSPYHCQTSTEKEVWLHHILFPPLSQDNHLGPGKEQGAWTLLNT